jgi:hypothetical protein
MRDGEPRRLGDLAEQGYMLGLNCQRCGHNRLLSPWSLFPCRSPATPWRWLRFRCEQCRSAEALVRIGSAAQLARSPVPLYERADLLAIVSDAVFVSLNYDGERLVIDRQRAHRVAQLVLRRMMAAGATVSPLRLPE